VVVCLFMMLVILIQKPKGGGLGSAFGGGGGGGSETAAFGAKTGDVLTWITVACFVLFLLLAMGLTWTIRDEVVPDAAAGQPVTAPVDEDADDADAEETTMPDPAAPVTGEPPAAGDTPGDANIDQVTPPDAPESPADAEQGEQTLETLDGEPDADTNTEPADQ
ncbi:MAG: preprotein translocase subunit SecG, partial [Phycisphaeraceae bacterium]